MKKIIAFLVVLLTLITAAILPHQAVYGSYEEVEGVTFTHSTGTKDINYIDPVKYLAILDASGYPKSAEVVINIKRARAGNITMYTADWHLKHTGLETKYELVVQEQNQELVITEINPNGNSYIPLDGFVLAFGSAPTETYNVGDTITLEGYDFQPATRAVESEENRVLIDAINTTRSNSMIVYYDSNYADKTGTNQWGVEITVELDENFETFSITDYREIGDGDSRGIDIPYFGFVLSAYGDPYRLKMAKGVLFNEGDELEVVGIPFIDLSATVETTYDVLNPTPETNPGGMEDEFTPFPSLRGADQLIVYTDSWDNSAQNGNGTGTGTNEWGYEIAVDSNGIVVETGINVSVIPEGGFVASGHGKGRDWLRSNAILGSECSYDESTKSLQLTTTADSYISVIKNNRDDAENRILDAERKLYDVDIDLAKSTLIEVDSEIARLETLSASLKADPDNFSNLVLFKESMDIARRLVDKVTYATYESRVIDSRGVWHRPNNAGYNELTLEGVEAFLDDLVHNNINSLYVETFFHGYVITPNLQATELHPWLAGGSYGEYGNDYLAALLGEAEERGIEVHAWVQNFNVGFEGMDYPTFLQENPSWILLNDDGTFLQRNEGGKYIFADPANPDVQSYLLDLYQELMTEYDFDGLHLDYIRYPVSYRAEDTGYTAYAINEFKEQNNISAQQDLNELVLADDDVYEAWADYKTEKVTTFVKTTVDMMHEFNTKKIISTAIFPDTAEATIKKNQDWPTWVKSGWIDVTTPMAYYTGASTVESKVKDMVLYVDGVTLNYGGIAPAFMGLDTNNNPLQAQAVRNGEAFGTVIFASQNLTGYSSVSDSFTLGIFSKEAVLPHDDINLILETMTTDIVGENGKADRIYIPVENMTEAEKTALKAELDRIKVMSSSTSEEVQLIIDELNTLIENVKDYGSGFADNRIKDDLTYLVAILQVRVTRLEIDEGIWVQPGTIVDPEPTDPEPTDPEPIDPEPTPEPEPETGCFGSLQSSMSLIAVSMIAAITGTVLIIKKRA